MFPVQECVVARSPGVTDGEERPSRFVRLLLYSIVELFLIPVYHSVKNPRCSVLNIGRIKAHATGPKESAVYI